MQYVIIDYFVSNTLISPSFLHWSFSAY